MKACHFDEDSETCSDALPVAGHEEAKATARLIIGVLVICTLSCALLRGRVNDCECCPAVLCWVIVGGIIAGVIALIVNNKKNGEHSSSGGGLDSYD